MALDLAKVQESLDARRRGTTNRDYTLPDRRQVELPGLEVNAQPRRQNSDAGEQIMRLLGLAQDTANSFAELGFNNQAKKNQELAGQAALDFQSGAKNEEAFAKFKAYRRSFAVEGGKAAAFKVDQSLTKAVQERLNDTTNPATIEDIQGLIDETFHAAAIGPDGKPVDFGDPAAALVVANQFAETRRRLMEGAVKIIKDQTDERTLSTIAFNAVQERLQGGPAPDLRFKNQPAAQPAPGALQAPTGRPPVRGPVTNNYAQHRARGSLGVDIDARIGEPVEAPAGGAVRIGRDGKSGLHVFIDHGNGVVSSYSHLSAVDVKNGDKVSPGQVFAKVGNTGSVSKKSGDGSHLHWRVKVNGNDVDPLSFKFGDTAGSSDIKPAADGAPQVRPAPYDFESLLARVPLSIDRGTAKTYLISALTTAAEENKDPELLDALWQSKRPDGTPSFNPKEIEGIRQARDTLIDKIDRDAEEAKRDRYEANAEVLMSAFAQGNTPTIATIREFEANDRISGQFATTLIDHIESQRRQDEREQRADQREADAIANREIDIDVAAEADLRRAGGVTSATQEDDLKRLRSGELGQGRAAVARFNSLRAATLAGAQVRLQDPETALWAEKLRANFQPKTGAGKSRVAAARNGAGGEEASTYPAMVKEYQRQIKEGASPAIAYQAAVKAYGPKPKSEDDAQKAARLRELRARAGR